MSAAPDSDKSSVSCRHQIRPKELWQCPDSEAPAKVLLLPVSFYSKCVSIEKWSARGFLQLWKDKTTVAFRVSENGVKLKLLVSLVCFVNHFSWHYIALTLHGTALISRDHWPLISQSMKPRFWVPFSICMQQHLSYFLHHWRNG